MRNGTLEIPKNALVSDGKPFDLDNCQAGNLTAIPVYSCLIEHLDGLVSLTPA